MPNPLRFVSRALLASVFVGGGINQLKDPGGFPASATDQALEEYGHDLGLPAAKTLVTINGSAMVAGGAALALGIKPKTAAALLGALLVPTTVVGHPFWKATDPGQKFRQRTEFISNLAILGGLLAVIVAKD